jgi:hypothetical protein
MAPVFAGRAPGTRLVREQEQTIMIAIARRT